MISNHTTTLKHGVTELVQVGIEFYLSAAFSSLQQALAGLGWEHYSHSAEVNHGLYFMLPPSCSQVQSQCWAKLWLLLSLCNPFRGTGATSSQDRGAVGSHKAQDRPPG